MQPTVITRPMAKFKIRSGAKIRKVCGSRLTRSCQWRSQLRTSRPDHRFPERPTWLRASWNGVMQNGLYVSLSAQVALEKRLETIADNVANMNTVGFRGTRVSFETEMAKTGDARLRYVSNGSDFISRRLGGLIKTDNALDFAVQGDAWFGIQTPQGVAYTRDGRTKIDESGMLRTLNGNPILDAGGAPILLDSGAGPLAVSADGMITQNGRQIGALGLFEIDPTANLKRAENSSVVPDNPATPVLDFTRDGVVQGAVEGSNVDPGREMTRLIEVTRAFEGAAAETSQAETSQSETSLQDAIKALGASA